MVTFHNQRDFVFFRHHRYIFEEKQRREKGKKEKVKVVKARLQVRTREGGVVLGAGRQMCCGHRRGAWWVLASFLGSAGGMFVRRCCLTTAAAICYRSNQLQEIGPRFTLKLQSLQKGTFDSKGGEFEWLLKPDVQETSRRKFQL